MQLPANPARFKAPHRQHAAVPLAAAEEAALLAHGQTGGHDAEDQAPCALWPVEIRLRRRIVSARAMEALKLPSVVQDRIAMLASS